MTGRAIINSKLVQIRKFLLLGLLIIPIMFCLGILFSKLSIFNILSVFFPMTIGSGYTIWLYYRVISVPCPFCDEKIPWDFKGYEFRLLSTNYKYCPYCRGEFDEQVNEGSKKSGSDNLSKMKAGEQHEKDNVTGRTVINSNISKSRFKSLIGIIVILLPIFGLYWMGVNNMYMVWMISLGFCLVIKLMVNTLSWTECPFCGERICLTIKENDKWKLSRDFLFCQHCGVSIDQQFHE